MAWKTKSLIPEDESDEEFIQSYPQYISEMVELWDAYRAEQFSSTESLFGYTTASLEGELPELFTDDFITVRINNEEQWQAACVRSLQKTTEFLNPVEHLPDYSDIADWPTESVLHDEMFYQITKYRFKIETSTGEMRCFKFEEPITNMDRLVSDMAPPVLDFEDPNNPTLDVYIEEEIEESQIEMPHHSLQENHTTNSFFESIFPSVNLLGVYTGAFSVGIFEVHRENASNAENVFNLMGMHSVELEIERYTNTIYLITYEREKYEDCQAFAESVPDVSIVDVYELLDYPVEGAEQVEGLRDEAIEYIHILPGIEYAVYGVQSGAIEPDLARYWPYVYYRPSFSVDGVKVALEDAKELYKSLRENKNMFNRIEGDAVEPLVDEFLQSAEQNVGWPETLSTLYLHGL